MSLNFCTCIKNFSKDHFNQILFRLKSIGYMNVLSYYISTYVVYYVSTIYYIHVLYHYIMCIKFAILFPNQIEKTHIYIFNILYNLYRTYYPCCIKCVYKKNGKKFNVTTYNITEKLYTYNIIHKSIGCNMVT